MIYMTIDDIKRLIASDVLRTVELKKNPNERKCGIHVYTSKGK